MLTTGETRKKIIYVFIFDQYKIGIITDKYAIEVPKSGCSIIIIGGIIKRNKMNIKYIEKLSLFLKSDNNLDKLAINKIFPNSDGWNCILPKIIHLLEPSIFGINIVIINNNIKMI
mgnify:FL=1